MQVSCKYIPPCGILSKPAASGVIKFNNSSSKGENYMFIGDPPPVVKL